MTKNGDIVVASWKIDFCLLILLLLYRDDGYCRECSTLFFPIYV